MCFLSGTSHTPTLEVRTTDLIQASSLLKARERSHSKTRGDLGPVLDRTLVLAPKHLKEKLYLLRQRPEQTQHSGSQPGCKSESPRGNFKK